MRPQSGKITTCRHTAAAQLPVDTAGNFTRRQQHRLDSARSASRASTAVVRAQPVDGVNESEPSAEVPASDTANADRSGWTRLRVARRRPRGAPSSTGVSAVHVPLNPGQRDRKAKGKNSGMAADPSILPHQGTGTLEQSGQQHATRRSSADSSMLDNSRITYDSTTLSEEPSGRIQHNQFERTQLESQHVVKAQSPRSEQSGAREQAASSSSRPRREIPKRLREAMARPPAGIDWIIEGEPSMGASVGTNATSVAYLDDDEEGEEGLEPLGKGEAVDLSERHPMWQPVLTDEDLARDPADHRSGYVAVIGKPNAGKSTLINQFVGQKLSIVTYKPQTTRHRIVGIASDDSYQMILFDTPGIIERRRTKLEDRMMAAVVSSVKNAEAIIAVVDSSDDPKAALAMFQPGSQWDGPPMAVLLNKSDLLSPEQVEELKAWYLDNCLVEAVFTGSALDPQGVALVKQWAVSKMPLGPTLYPKQVVSEQPEKFFVSEIVREKIFLLYSQEIPYCSQVVITEFKERPDAKDYIHATIMVEKESQKGILIGKNASALKKLGEEARRDIEAFLERPVYLELGVEVAKDWRDQEQSLKDYGYFDPLLV